MAKAVIESRGVWEGIGRWEQVSGGADVRFSDDYAVHKWDRGEPVGEVLFTIPKGTKAKAWGEAGYDAKLGYTDPGRTCAILCVAGIDADMPLCRNYIDGFFLANRGYVIPIPYLESYNGTAESTRVVILGEPDRDVAPQGPEEPELEDIVVEELEEHTINVDGHEGRLFTMMQGGMLRAFMEVTREDGTVEVVPAHMGTGLPAEEQAVEEQAVEEQAVEEQDVHPYDYGETDEYRLGDPRED